MPGRTTTSTTVITARSGWGGIDIGELAGYRELASVLVWRNLKIRYRQTFFGAAWAVVQPLGLMTVLALSIGRIVGGETGGAPYALFALSGLVPWTFFAQGVLGSSTSLVDGANLLQKVYFPRLLLPIAAVASYLVDLAIAEILLFGALSWFGFGLGLKALWLIPLMALLVVTVLALGIWLAAVNVRFRDVRHALPFIVQFGLFASPVAYSSGIVPSEWRFIYSLNPMAGIIEGFRWALLPGVEAPVSATMMAVIVSLLLLCTGLFYFRRVERTFADVI